jgi:hypothetical protein
VGSLVSLHLDQQARRATGRDTRTGMRYTVSVSPDLRRYLLLEHGIGSAVFNFVLNGVLAWLLFRGVVEVPLWGQQSIAGDTIGTTLLLPLLTCLIVTPLVRRHLHARDLGVIGWSPLADALLRWLPAGTFRRGLWLGTACMVAVAPLAIGALGALGIARMPFWGFVTFKATFAAGLALAVQPLIALWVVRREKQG